MSCPGSLPSAPYPGEPIYMTAIVDPITHIIDHLVYLDRVLGFEPIFEREGLCSRAGCKCTDWGIVCNNYEYAYFDLTIHSWYSSQCHETCGCKRLVSPPNTTNATGAVMGESGANETTTVQSNSCLAGEDAEWTTKQEAKCCPGYIFLALTLEEADGLYGLPSNATEVDNSGSTIGVCSNATSTRDISVS